jgi:hypothetical protein
MAGSSVHEPEGSIVGWHYRQRREENGPAGRVLVGQACPVGGGGGVGGGAGGS